MVREEELASLALILSPALRSSPVRSVVLFLTGLTDQPGREGGSGGQGDALNAPGHTFGEEGRGGERLRHLEHVRISPVGRSVASVDHPTGVVEEGPRHYSWAVAACAHSSGARLVAGLLSTSGTVGLGTPSLPRSCDPW